MNHRFLENRFIETRKQQIKLFNRDFTAMDLQVSEIMFNTAVAAINNVKTGNRETCMQAVSLATGLGKSASAYALIATFCRNDPHFSAAYVVPTIKMAMEAQEGIEKLLGVGTTTLWSSYHKHKGVDRTKAMGELGFIPDRLVNKNDLTESRVVIVTHGQLQHELKTGRDEGTLNYLGKPRSVVFIDEHPDLLQVVDATAGQLQDFYDNLVMMDCNHPWLPVISNVVHRMATVVRTEGQTYIPTELLSKEEGQVFSEDHGLSLWDLTDEEMSDDRRFGQLKGMRDLVVFLQAASKGSVFYSRKDWTFFAYQLNFTTTYPGFVLLDATSDLTGLVCLHPKVKPVDVPQVNYSNLDMRYITMPPKFKRIKEIIKRAPIGREYAQFIYQTVMANTESGNEVLLVVHKDVLTQELIGSSEDPARPLNWEGRKVNTQNWGGGVGLNKFKHKTHVFLFGDFYMPRAVTIAQTHGWSQKPVSEGMLKLAEGIKKSGDVYAPQGDYLRPHEGHLLRWSKQLAMRGTARQVDEKGNCFAMKLFTTMDLTYLLPNLYRLFPGVMPPKQAEISKDDHCVDIKGRQGLIKLLLATTSKAIIGADEIEIVTGIKSSKLSREFYAVEETIRVLGWRIATARELGIAGRTNYLVNDARLGLQTLKAS